MSAISRLGQRAGLPKDGSTFASDVGMNSLESVVRMQHHCHVISVVALGMATLTERRETGGFCGQHYVIAGAGALIAIYRHCK